MSFLDRLVVRAEREPEPDTIARRLAMLPMTDLPMWVDTTISQTGKAVQAYLRDGDVYQLEEAKIAAKSLVALLEEIEKRTAVT